MILAYILSSYLVGCVLTAYIIGAIKGIDLRTEHSGNLGARNVGRVFGKGAFVVTVVVDGLKGIIVVLAGKYLGIEDIWIAVAIFFVVLGHIHPFWLKFQGGKGVATGIGSLLFFSPTYLIVFLASILLSLPIIKSATLSMVIGFIVYIVFLLLIGRFDLFGLMAMLALVIWSHRQNIRERRS